jgi:hypothetical protein
MFPILNKKKNILKKKKKIHQQYEFGAHFKYTDLFGRLINLINTLPKERLGDNGIYFIDDNKKNNNSTDLIKNFYKKNNLVPSSLPISLKNKYKLALKLKNNSKSIDQKKTLLFSNYLFNLPNKKNNKSEFSNNYSIDKNIVNDNNISKNKTSNFSFLKNNRNKQINNIYKIYNFNDKIFHTIDNNSDLKLPKIEYKFKFNKKI